MQNLAQKKTKNIDEFGRVVPAWDKGFIEYFNKNILIDIDAIAKYAVLSICVIAIWLNHCQMGFTK